MWPKRQQPQQQLLTTAAVIGICLLAATTTSASASASNSVPGPASTSLSKEHNNTTTSQPFPLQPPTAPQNVSSTTQADLSDSVKELNKQAAGAVEQLEHVDDQQDDTELDSETETETDEVQTTTQFLGVPGFLPTIVPETTMKLPANGHGYIQFQVNDELPVEAVRRQNASKQHTVNEVLSSLFPNGFSDIFRFSYPGDSSSTEQVSTEPATEPPSPSTSTTATTTTKTTDVVRPTLAQAVSSTTVAPAKNQTYYSYRTTVTKEYRRELRPGHTQIVVEQIARLPQEPFKDGTNHITKDELLRINRAAVAAPVLPSLLLRPNDENENMEAAESAPIVILGEHESEFDESQSYEDNLIAESRHAGQQYYQQQLPVNAAEQQGIESFRQQQGPGQEQQINVHIVHDDTLAKAQEQPSPVSVQPQPAHALDHYQAHSEQHFQQRHQTQEAPSRQFLKNFKPAVSGSAEGPLPKGSFHYELSNPPQRPNAQQASEADYVSQFVKPAAQLAYQRELSHVQQQPLEFEKLHTQAIASPAPPAAQPSYHNYQGYGGSTSTPQSLVYVTLNTPNPPHASPAPQPPVEVPPPAHAGPSPHEYVSEAAAAPSQHHVYHAPPPLPAQPEVKVKPHGYTFVEVQKSVNIHNKLITEKDGRLVEQHETIYHQPQQHHQQNHITADYSPKKFVESAATAAPTPQPAKNYVSLANNPIHVQHVDYDSSPQEVAISHAAVQLDSDHHAPAPVHTAHSTVSYHAPAVVHSISDAVDAHHSLTPPPSTTIIEKLVPQPYPVHIEKPVEKLVDRPYPVKQIVEKHVPVPYAQPVPVPVHVDHYIDRPYPVETIVEQPVPYPYPVETVVEKIIEKHVPVEVERIVEKPVEVEKIVEKFVDRPMAIPIHVPVAIHMPVHSSSSHGFNFSPHPNALPPWSHATSVAHIPPKVLQNYYTRMLKKLLPQLTAAKTQTKNAASAKPATPQKPLRSVPLGEAPKVATFSLADMRFDLRPPPPPQGSPWLQGSRYIYNTLPADLATAAASAPAQMVKSYIGPVATNTAQSNEFDEFQRWRNGHSLKRSPDFGRNLQMEYGFKPPLVPSMEIDDKGNPLKQADAEPQ